MEQQYQSTFPQVILQGRVFATTIFSNASDDLRVCALFIRDVRDIRGYQNLIQQNDVLLSKILPSSIAERLKDSFRYSESDASSDNVLIADSHDCVSILFADIVKCL